MMCRFSDKDLNGREQWSRKAEYLLSLTGYIVGFGNLWRFPYICMRNGGGAFLIQYVFFLVFCGIPLFFLESAVGQFSGKSSYHVWEVCPIFKGNTCIKEETPLSGLNRIPYCRQNVLQYSSGLENLGHLNWHLVLCLIVGWIIVGLCIMKGVKSVGKVWTEAALQVFFSLGPGWGGIITMSSFNKFKNNCLRDSVMLCVLCEGTSLYCGLVIFTVLGYLAAKLALPLDKIVKSGCEVVMCVFTDSFKFVRRRRLVFLVIYCYIQFLLGLVLCTQGGIYVFQVVDWYVSAFAIPIFGLLECIVFAWIYGLDRLSQDVQMMLGKGVPMFIRVCLRFVTPAVLLGIIVASFIGYKPPTYGSYRYPEYGVGIGILISILPLIPIPICALIAVRNAEGLTLFTVSMGSL